MTTSSVKKTCISLKMKNWQRLAYVKNRSAIINQALELYFDREDYMEIAEEDWVSNQIHKINDFDEK